jgi:hypothetical protein
MSEETDKAYTLMLVEVLTSIINTPFSDFQGPVEVTEKDHIHYEGAKFGWTLCQALIILRHVDINATPNDAYKLMANAHPEFVLINDERHAFIKRREGTGKTH